MKRQVLIALGLALLLLAGCQVAPAAKVNRGENVTVTKPELPAGVRDLTGPLDYMPTWVYPLDDDHLLIANGEGIAKLDIRTGSIVREIDGDFRSILTWQERPGHIVVVENGKARLLDLRSRSKVDLGFAATQLYGLRRSMLYYAEPYGPGPEGQPGRVMVRDMESGKVELIVKGEEIQSYPQKGALSPDGRRLVITSGGHSQALCLHVIDLETRSVHCYSETGGSGESPLWMGETTVAYGFMPFAIDTQTGAISSIYLPVDGFRAFYAHKGKSIYFLRATKQADGKYGFHVMSYILPE